ncbi:MAG: hypothetical protein IPG04_09495 [Polyangiaceae bacterium]|nr:hypothetical protein [Polyangiaceae bacterium]
MGRADSEPPPSVPPPSGRAPATGADGALKSLLRKFVVRTAAEYLGRDAAAGFTARLLQCFGWPEAGPADAELPGSLAVVEGRSG